MTYKQAETKLADLLNRQGESHAAAMEILERNAVAYKIGVLDEALIIRMSEEDRFNYNSLIDDSNKAAHEIKNFTEGLACNPAFFDIMMPWMVDIRGKDEPQAEALLATAGAPTHANIKSMLETAGALPKSVRDWLEEQKYPITDSGGGAGGWHLGIPCTEPQARMLCSDFHIQFRDPIRAGLLTIVRHFWGWKLPTMHNWEQAKNYKF